MNYGEIITQATRQLQRRNINDARKESELLLSFVLKKSIEYIITNLYGNVTNHQRDKYRALLLRRCHHEPMAYILKSAPFHGQSFLVNRHTLIPRPETEQLVEIASTIIKQNNLKRVVELGTGSGVIAITLARQSPKIRLFASDISPEALSIARINAQRQKVLKRITFKRGNLLKPWRNIKADMLIANLPYVSQAELKKSPTKSELKYEPRQALFGGKDGLDLFREMFDQIARLENRLRLVLIEFGWGQAKEISNIVNKKLPNYELDIVRDNGRVQRFAVLSRVSKNGPKF